MSVVLAPRVFNQQSGRTRLFRSIFDLRLTGAPGRNGFVLNDRFPRCRGLRNLLAGHVLGIPLDADEPLGVAEIAARVEKTFPHASTGGEATAIEKTLAEFHRLGLAEPEAT